MSNCLMIKTKYHQLLTDEKHLDSLMEFAKTFDAEIFLVKPKKGQKVLGIRKLMASLCEGVNEEVQCEIIEQLCPKSNKRQLILDRAKTIRESITQLLLSGETVSLKELKKQHDAVTVTCLCHHFSEARKNLSEQGNEFEKTGAGTYKRKIDA